MPELTKVEKHGDKWFVFVFSPVPGCGWIAQGNGWDTKEQAVTDSKNWQ